MDAQAGGQSARTKELESCQAALEEKIKALTQALAAATKRHEIAERQATYLSQQKKALEAEVAAGGNQTQAQLRIQMQEQRQLSDAQVGDLMEQAKEFEASRAAVDEKIESLNQALAAETKHRENAEQQTASLNLQRNALETDLTASKQTQAELRTQLEEQQRLAGAQVQSHKLEIEKLTGRSKELEASGAAMEEKVQSLTQAMAAAVTRAESAEQQSASLSQQRNALEADLTVSRQAQAELHAQLEEQQRLASVEVQSHKLEVESLIGRVKDFESSAAAMDEKIKSLNQALAAETERSESAGKQVTSLSRQRNVLETELAASKQGQVELGAQLVEQQQLASLAAAELEGFRKCASAEATRQEQQLAKLEKARTELDNQLNDARALLATREAAIGTFEIELQQRRDAQERQEQLFQGEVAQRHQAEAQIENVQKQLAESSNQLAQKCAAEQAWPGLEAKLQGCIREQQDDLAQSRDKLASQGAEIKNARKKIEELQERQSVLSLKVEGLTEESKAAAQVIAKLEARTMQSETEVKNGHKELAGLRYATLDASRMDAQLNRERLQQERQNLDGTRQLLSVLAQTPLSMAQRKMLGELQNVMVRQQERPAETAAMASCPVEMPNFRISEFSLAEVSEGAFGIVRDAAEAAGVAVKCSTSGMVSAKVIGYAENTFTNCSSCWRFHR